MIDDLRHGITAARLETSLKAAAGFAFGTFLLVHVLPAWLLALAVGMGVFIFVWRRYP